MADKVIKTYKLITKANPMYSRSVLVNGSRSALPPIEFNGQYYSTSNPETQAFLDKHPHNNKFYECVQERPVGGAKAAKPAPKEPEKELKDVEVNNINEAIDLLKEAGADTKGKRSWADAIATGKDYGLNIIQS